MTEQVVARQRAIGGGWQERDASFDARRYRPDGEQVEFSIDELREIARHFGVVNVAEIVDRRQLVQAIRRRI